MTIYRHPATIGDAINGGMAGYLRFDAEHCSRPATATVRFDDSMGEDACSLSIEISAGSETIALSLNPDAAYALAAILDGYQQHDGWKWVAP